MRRQTKSLVSKSRVSRLTKKPLAATGSRFLSYLVFSIFFSPLCVCSFVYAATSDKESDTHTRTRAHTHTHTHTHTGGARPIPGRATEARTESDEGYFRTRRHTHPCPGFFFQIFC